MLTHPLLPKLRELKLSGMLETLEARTQLAQETRLSPTEFLALLLDDEIERRESLCAAIALAELVRLDGGRGGGCIHRDLGSPSTFESAGLCSNTLPTEYVGTTWMVHPRMWRRGVASG